MKIIVSSFLLFLSIQVFAQIPDYFGNNPEWREKHFSASSGITERNFGVYISGDTTINGIAYKVFGIRGRTSYPYSMYGPPPENFHYPQYRFFRQDGRKIYWYNTQYQTDELYISYDLNIGDSLTDCGYLKYGSSLFDRVLDKIDSIQIGNEFRRVLYFDTLYFFHSLTLIEGIAHRYDPYDLTFIEHQNLSFEVSNAIYCYAQNGQPLWPDTSTSYCDNLHLLSIDEKSATPITVFPNPASDFIEINAGSQMRSVQVFDLLGKCVLHESVTGALHQFDVSHLKAGWYNALIVFDDKTTNQTQFVKH